VRSTTDLLILMIAGTVCVGVLLSIIGIGIVEIVDPSTDTTAGSAAVASIVNVLIGLLAGFLAGRTQRNAGSSDS